MERRQRSSLTAGLLLIAVGMVFFVGQLDWRYAEMFRFHELWPLILMAIGVAKLLQPEDAAHSGARGGGGWMVFMSVIFLLHNFDVLPLSKSWPLFVIASGVTVMLHRHHDRDVRAGGER